MELDIKKILIFLPFIIDVKRERDGLKSFTFVSIGLRLKSKAKTP